MTLRRLLPSSSVASKAFTLGASKRSLALAVRFHETGDASKVLKLETLDSSFVNAQLGSNEVGLKFLAAPINPSDINIANGTYGISPKLPAIAGNEGVAEISAVGSGVKGLKVGDRVLPLAGAFGTWTQYNKTDAKNVMPIDSEIPVAYAATLTINPATAYRLLRDFVNLKPGDVIIQNGSNSVVGLCVTQLARDMGVTVINVVREDRPNYLKQLKMLTLLGIKMKNHSEGTIQVEGEDLTYPIFDQQYSSINVTDTFMKTPQFREMLNELPPIKLGLNCVGGEAATDLARTLGNGATLVTYGGMSKKHLTIPFDLLTSKQLKLEGFWIAEWYAKHSLEERKVMYDDLVKAIKNNKLKSFFQMVDLDDFEYALKKSQEPYYPRKIVLNCDFPDRFAEHDKRPADAYWVFDTTYK